MMELALNEISHNTLLEDKYRANERMQQFSKTVAEARKIGFRKIRTHFSASEIKLTNDYTLHDWLFDKDFSAEMRTLFYDMLVQPFLKEDDQELEKKYIESYYYFEDTENDIPKQQCLGLASAHLSETLCISFQSSPAWLKNTLNIIIENENGESFDKVYHIYSNECLRTEAISSFVESISTTTLIETSVKPNEKKIHITKHHGQKEMNEIWNKIKKSPYVIEGISIEWGGNTFYKNPQKNGKVDIVDLKSDRRYAIQIQTTGRNLRETIEIANQLLQEYG